MKSLLFFLFPLLLLTSCGSKGELTTIPTEQTNECRYKSEVCNEATQFQMDYSTMTKEQQKEMIAVLNSYIEQCERARKMCKDSRK